MAALWETLGGSTLGDSNVMGVATNTLGDRRYMQSHKHHYSVQLVTKVYIHHINSQDFRKYKDVLCDNAFCIQYFIVDLNVTFLSLQNISKFNY